MLERIVAAIDREPSRSQKVIAAAGELARMRDSNVLVVHVREVERPTATMIPTARPSAAPPVFHIETEERAQELVEGAVEQLHAAGVQAEGRVGPGSGTTARELLDIARQYGATLIVVGDRGSQVSDLLLGSVANRILHLADCPVLLVR
jgi:universal stress protein A